MDKIVLKYMGDGSEVWSCVPPRDLTQADLKRVKEISHDQATILEFARFSTGEPLYMTVADYKKHLKGLEAAKEEVKDNGSNTE